MSILSIIVPVYNVSSMIKRCIESLINQSYKNIEIIIINDGSTDDSFEYIKPYLSIEKIKYFEQENHGLGSARNLGITKASGEYITFVDSDDWIDLDLYQEMMNAIKLDYSDIAICGVKNEYDNFCSSEERYNYMYHNIVSGAKALSMLTKCENNNNMISPVVWNKIYKTDLIRKNSILFLENSYWEDDIFSFKIMLCAKTISIIPDVYYHYYQRERSITNDFSKKHIIDLISSFKELKTFTDNYTSEYDMAKLFNSYFDRAIQSLFKMLFNKETSTSVQKEYILYFYEMFSSEFSVYNALEYLDINRIKRLFK